MKSLTCSALISAFVLCVMPRFMGAAQDPPPAAPPLTLRRCIDQALLHNRDIKSSRLALQASRLALESSEAAFSPLSAFSFRNSESRGGGPTPLTADSFSTGASISKRLITGGTFSLQGSNDVTFGLEKNVSQSLGFSFTQPLLRGAGRDVAEAPIRSSQNAVLVSTESLAQVLIDVVTLVESSYFGLGLVRESLDIQAQALERSRQLKTTTEALIEAGRLARNEIFQAEADIASQEVAYIEAEEAVLAAENQLRDILDSELASPIVPETPDLSDPQPRDRSSSLDRAFQNRPDWKIAQIALVNADIDLRAARRNRLYGLDLGFDVSGGGSGPSFGRAWTGLRENRSASISLVLDLPFNNAPSYNSYLSAELSRQQTQLQVQELRQQIELQVDNAVRRSNQQLRQLEVTRRARQLAEQSLSVENEKLRVGRSTGFQVVRLQNDVNVALLNELQARVNYVLALAELERTAGTTLLRWNIDVQP